MGSGAMVLVNIHIGGGQKRGGNYGAGIHGVMSRPLPPCLPSRLSAQQTLPAPTEGGEDDDTAVEGREGKSIPGGGADDASGSDDDLQVTWEVDSPEAARDVGVAAGAAGGKPETAESTGGSLREGTSTSSPSTVVSREGSFRCGESIPPASSSSSSSNSGHNSTSSPVLEDGDGDTVEKTARGYAKPPAERPKGDANRLKSLGWRGETLASSRLRGMRERIADRLEAGSDARALLVEILEEDTRKKHDIDLRWDSEAMTTTSGRTHLLQGRRISTCNILPTTSSH